MKMSSRRPTGLAAKKSSSLVPRNFCSGSWFLFGLWLALVLLGPLIAPWASAADPELVRLEAALHQSVNRFRSEQHLIVLTRDPALDAVARAHSEDMAARQFFSHQSPEGHNWVDRLQRFGIDGFSMAGENVGMTNRPNPNQEILQGWLTSPAHRENLTARPFNATGIGIARAPDGTFFYTQLYLSFPRE
jgi:uncharacterized protein YkwD